MEPLGSDDPVRIGEYRLLRRRGAGGMGRVYLGRTAGGRTVAVKVVRGELAEDPEFRARFRQEVEAARLVGGDWTAPVLDADTESAHPWVATGYVAGPALTAAVRDFGPLPDTAVRAMGAGLAGALAHVHALGLVHRDVKPSNVLLTLDGPRLIDFGIARALDAAGTLTQSGFVVGSPGYMSPEQAQGATAGPASDVFSLGAVLAYAATGTAPFGDGVSAAVLLYRVLHEQPDLSRLDGGLLAIVRDCLAKDPAARPRPDTLRERLLAEGAGTVRLGQGGWLPPALSAAVGRSAVELLGLDHVPEPDRPAPAAVADYVPTWAQPALPADAVPVLPAAPAGPPPAVRRPRRVALTVALALLGVLAASLGGLKLYQAQADGTPTDDHTITTTSSTSLGSSVTASTSRSATTVAAPPPSTPAPSTGTSTGTSGPAGPNVVPAAFVGAWRGDMTSTHTGLPAGTTTVTVRAAALGAETTTSVNGLDGLITVSCEGAWTLTSASERELVFTSRLVRSNPPGLCTGGSSKETLTLQADGSIRFTSVDPGAGSPSGVLRKVG